MPVTRGFNRRRETTPGDRLPPGQYLERGFPVLSAGPTPETPLDEWTFRITGAVDAEREWTWEEFQALEKDTPTVAQLAQMVASGELKYIVSSGNGTLDTWVQQHGTAVDGYEGLYELTAT